MAVYAYEAIDRRGKNVKGVIDADNPRAARAALKKQGLFATNLEEAQREEAETARTGGTSLFGRAIPLGDLALITRQLATLIDAGLPLVDALGALVEQTEQERIRLVFSQIRQNVNEGSSFHEALGNHRRIFNDLYRNLVKTGEMSGTLPLVLERLADFLESSLELRRKIQAAMAYPALMTVVGIAILFILFTKVVPQVVNVFINQGRELPAPTKLLLSMSEAAQAYWPAAVAALAVGGVGFWAYHRTPGGKKTVHGLVLRVPRLGPFIRLVALTRFAKTLGTLLDAGVPLLDGLAICAPVVGNKVIEGAILQCAIDVREGKSLTLALHQTGQFPPEIKQMVAVGEKSGALHRMLLKVAEAYEGRTGATLTALTSLIEPLMIIGMGGVVGFVVYSILLPIVEMSSALQ